MTALALVGIIAALGAASCQRNDDGIAVANETDNAAVEALADVEAATRRIEAEQTASLKRSAHGSDSAADTYTAAKMNLEATLKDADSVRYRNMFVSRLSGGNLVLCGEVNSKNGFGAYTGFQGFIAHPDPSIPPIVDDTATGGDDDAANKLYAGMRRQACQQPVERF